MTPQEIKSLRDKAERATQGEWAWYGDSSSHSLYLAAPQKGRLIVMDFVRWGTNRAQPRFRDEKDLMVKAQELVEHEVDYRKTISNINNPDAQYIAAANPQVVLGLLDEIERLRNIIQLKNKQHADMCDSDMSNMAKIESLQEECDTFSNANKAAFGEIERLTEQLSHTLIIANKDLLPAIFVDKSEDVTIAFIDPDELMKLKDEVESLQYELKIKTDTLAFHQNLNKELSETNLGLFTENESLQSRLDAIEKSAEKVEEEEWCGSGGKHLDIKSMTNLLNVIKGGAVDEIL